MKTTDWVKDMESIRKALGAQQINYYGFSYGTYLGQVYATLHPDRVRRFVFDGVVDPRGVWYDANLDQDVAFDKNIDIYFDWVAKHDDVYAPRHRRRRRREALLRVLDQLRTAPGAAARRPRRVERRLRVGAATTSTAGPTWPTRSPRRSTTTTLGHRRCFDGANGQGPGADNTYAVYIAVQCTDASWTTNWSTW